MQKLSLSLGFDYVERIHSDQLEDTALAVLLGRARTSFVHMLTNKEIHRLNTVSWTGWTVLSWSCSQEPAWQRMSEMIEAHDSPLHWRCILRLAGI